MLFISYRDLVLFSKPPVIFTLSTSFILLRRICKPFGFFVANCTRVCVDTTCCIFRLSLENIVQVRSFASSFLCSNLVSACDRIIHENFEALAASAVLLSLTGPELCRLLESDNLQVSSEEQVFHSIIAWCEHRPPPESYSYEDLDNLKTSKSFQSLAANSKGDEFMLMSTGAASSPSFSHTFPPEDSKIKNDRLKFLPDLLSRVRLPFLSVQFIRDVVSKNTFIREDIRCRDLLDEARDLLLLPESMPTNCSFVCRPRRGQEVPGIIYAVGGYSSDGYCQSIVEAYHPLLERWEVVESMVSGRNRIAVVSLKGTHAFFIQKLKPSAFH